ncbi:MAG TPA: hypothetical protein VLK66_16270 [Longimicrobium sp.]|nr:hypothetical protein [Longimicrobium sp.]
MEPQDNKKLALQKAISSHEQAEAALADLMKDEADPRYTEMLERVHATLAELRAAAGATAPGETV